MFWTIKYFLNISFVYRSTSALSNSIPSTSKNLIAKGVEYKRHYLWDGLMFSCATKPGWSPRSCMQTNLQKILFQDDLSPISEDACALLERVTTLRLELSFHSRGEARRVLRTISFRPHSRLELCERSAGPDRWVPYLFVEPSNSFVKGEGIVLLISFSRKSERIVVGGSPLWNTPCISS